MNRKLLPALLVVALGCTRTDREPLAEVEDAPPATADASQEGPGPVYVDQGRCPFECCTYREWSAQKPLRAYAAERDTATVAFALAKDERFQALTGNVHVDPVGIAVVRQPVSWFTEGGTTGTFNPGDTLYILSYVGEGSYRVWHRDQVAEVAAFWAATPGLARRDTVPEGVLLREPGYDWWVKIRNGAGRIGWLRMDEAEVGNADGCGM